MLTQSLSYTPTYKPQILASGTMSIQWGIEGAQNIGGILSANSLNLTGSGSFVNNDLHTDTMTYARHWVHDDDSRDHEYLYVSNPATFNSYPDVDTVRRTWTSVGNNESLARDNSYLTQLSHLILDDIA